MFHLGNRYDTSIWVNPTEFKGQIKIHIRHFNDHDNKPSTRGIALNLDEWDKFKEHFEQIDLEVRRLRCHNERRYTTPGPIPGKESHDHLLSPFGSTYSPSRE